MLHSSFDDPLFYKKKTPYESVLCTDLIKCGWISISLFQLWGKHYWSHTRGERWRQAGRNSSSNRETLSGSNSGLLSWNIICTPPHIPLLIINFGVRMASGHEEQDWKLSNDALRKVYCSYLCEYHNEPSRLIADAWNVQLCRNEDSKEPAKVQAS